MTNIPDFPSNSKTKKVEAGMPEHRILKPIEGNVQYKTSLSKKFKRAFLGDDGIDVKAYIFDEILVPGIKGVIADIFYGFGETVEMALFGKTARRRGASSNSIWDFNTRISYDGFSKETRKPNKMPARRSNIEDLSIILESKAQGEYILETLCDLIEEYGAARVADLNELLKRTGDFIDTEWGWTNLAQATIDRGRGGYELNLPRPIPLKG